MYSQKTVHQWKILKYRQLKSLDQTEKKDALLMLDTSKRLLCVFRNDAEIENVSYDRPAKTYPKLKYKEFGLQGNLYVVMNSKFEGFRITFNEEDKHEFLRIMRNFVEVSASSQPCSAEKRPKKASSNYQAMTSEPILPPKRPVARNLSATYFEPVHNPYATPAPKGSCSQPIDNPYARTPMHGSCSQPAYNQYTAPEQQGSYSQPAYNPYSMPTPVTMPPQHYSTSYAEDPFAIFDSYTRSDGSSPAGSIPSSVGSVHSQQSSVYSPLPFNNFSQPEPTSSPYTISPLSSTPPVPPTPTPAPQTPAPVLVNKSNQTDDLMDQLTENPTFMMECMRTLMRNPLFSRLVASTRAEIQSMSEEKRNKLYKDTDPSPKIPAQTPAETQPSLPSSSQPPPIIHHGNSDLEFEETSSRKRV